MDFMFYFYVAHGLLRTSNCRVGGMLLLELNRVLRPGGYFVWSATPVYQKLQEDVEIWKGRIPILYWFISRLDYPWADMYNYLSRNVFLDGLHVLGACHHSEG